MTSEYARIMRGLLENRGLTPALVSRTTGRARSTISRLLAGDPPPSPEALAELAPVLQMPVADLLVIAGLSTTPAAGKPLPYAATEEIGHLVAVATALSPVQVERLIQVAQDMRDDPAR